MYYLIQNDGLIIPEDLKYLGGSTKRDNPNTIGHYGSGAKFMTPFYLRNNIPFFIYSGLNLIKVETHDVEYRGQTRQIIFINDMETSITVEFGPEWDAWQALRETICNALDEPNPHFEFTDEIVPIEGKTRIYIEVTEQIRSVLNNFNNYFCFERTANYTVSGTYRDSKNAVRIFDKPNISPVTIYRKGIRCVDEYTQKSRFDYDFLSIPINESRVLNGMYLAQNRLGAMIAQTVDIDLIQKFIYYNQDSALFESTASFYDATFSDTWYELLKDKTVLPQSLILFIPLTEFSNPIVLSDSLFKQIFEQFPTLKTYRDYTKDNVPFKEVENQLLLQRITLLVAHASKHFPTLSDYTIRIVDFGNDNTYGTVHKGAILLSTKLEYLDMEEIMAVILEEYFHNESGFSDFTREFQNYLFKQIIKLIK